MSKAASSTPSSKLLQAALTEALGCYDLKPDITGLMARIPREAGPLRADDVQPLLARLELDVSAQDMTPEQVRAQGLPAVLVYGTGFACAFVPTRGRDGIFTPEPKAPLARGVAQVFAIHPPLSASRLDTKHMKHGHSLDWFWEPVKRFWKQYMEILVVSIFTNLLMLTLPIFSMSVYDRVAVNFSQSTLIVLTVGAVLAFSFDFIFKTTRAYILELVAARTGAKYDLDLMERFLSISSANLNVSVGERTNIFRELQGIKDFYAMRLMPALVDVPFFFLFVGVIYVISPGVALVPICAAVAILLLNRILEVPTNRSTRENFATMQSKSTTLVQTLLGAETIRMLGATGAQLFHWNVISHKSVETSRRSNMLSAINNNLCVMITYLITVFVLFVGVFEVAAGTLTTGGMVACSMLAGRSIGSIAALSGLLSRMKQSSNVLKAIDQIFALPHEDLSKLTTAEKGNLKGMIEMHEVSYAYPGQSQPALHKASLVIQPGERIGLIGRTGAGKSTLARMITRALQPDAGRVELDQYNLQSFSSEELHRAVSYIPQETFFFAGSIRSNILMGVNHVDEQRLMDACRMSGLDAILQSSGRTIDIDVGENGNKLSGGQRQAVALARALVRDPKVVVFDEPVNGIDSSLEMHIKQSLATYLQGRTFIMITHRTSLLSLVDRLVMVERGRIVADGPRDEILQRLGGAPAPREASHA